jgi:hypothetical protein
MLPDTLNFKQPQHQLSDSLHYFPPEPRPTIDDDEGLKLLKSEQSQVANNARFDHSLSVIRYYAGFSKRNQGRQTPPSWMFCHGVWLMNHLQSSGLRGFLSPGVHGVDHDYIGALARLREHF